MKHANTVKARFVRTIVMLAGIVLAASFAQAEEAEAVRAGRELVQKKCLSCHALSRSSSQSQTRPGAPSFEEIAAGPKKTREALRAFLLSTNSSVSHPGGMPALKLTEDQIDLIYAYLSSLQR